MLIPVDIPVATAVTLTPPPDSGALRIWDNISYYPDPLHLTLTQFQGVTIKRGDTVQPLDRPVTLAPGFPLTITPAVAGTPGWVRGYYEMTHHIAAGDVGLGSGHLYLGARAIFADTQAGFITTSSVREYRTRFKTGPVRPSGDGKGLVLYHFGSLTTATVEVWSYNPYNTTWTKDSGVRQVAEFPAYGGVRKTIYTCANWWDADTTYEIRVSGISSKCKLMLCDPAGPPAGEALGNGFLGPALVYNVSALTSEVATSTTPALTATPQHLSFEAGDVGIPVAYGSGATTTRPPAWPPGAPYFDTTLGKPIWKRLADGVWVDATGTAV